MSYSFTITAEVEPSYSFAAWQNSIPLLRSLGISNNSANPVGNVQLNLSTPSGFLKPKTWQIDRLLAGDELALTDRSVELDPEFLTGLNEAEKNLIHFRLEREGDTLATLEIEVRVLARNEWGGMSQGGELVAAFVMPNDPAIAKILKSAARVLERHGHSPALDGYQSGDPQRAYLLMMAIWNATAALKLTYANPPKSFEHVGQKTRTPEIVIEQGLATCLDTSLLFAAAIEAVGLNPIVLMTDGHCFAGAWLVEKTLNQIVEEDSSEIRKALAGHELITFETTHVTQTPPGRFEDAIRVAKSTTNESKEDQFVAAVDIARARMAQINPLASHSPNKPDADDKNESKSVEAEFLPLSLPADFPTPATTTEEKPTTPSGRIDRWQRKLLDLTLRNRLLNFRTTQQSIPILCNDIAKLEDLLADDKRMKLISLPDQNPIGKRDKQLHQKQTNRELDTQFATAALNRNEVSCELAQDQLDKRLTNIYRAVRNDMAEGGSNTLYMAVGFLRWRQRTGGRKTYRAPLLLMPVKLTRKSSQSPFHLRMHEDETRFNATLIQLLKQDFGKDLSSFESGLPVDDSGVDVPLILQQVRQHVRDVSGFEVVDECALGRFSFSKYLLWRDLVDRTDQLKNNRVVKHLLDNPHKPFASGDGPVPRPADMDTVFHPAEIFHPLDADSSQLAAVMAVAAGKDLVLIGPPGTGKSQTITNMIAQCLAIGKTVLFVAEKTAALDVVHRRLVQHGLGDCCVELHSNKAQRKEFLQQLQQNWRNNRKVKNNDWLSISERLRIRRDELNQYVATIHARQPNGWTAFEAFGEAVKGANTAKPKFDWRQTVRHDRDAYEKLETAVEALAVSFESLGESETLPVIAATDWSMKWENALLESSTQLEHAVDDLKSSLAAFTGAIGLPAIRDASVAELEEFKMLARTLSDCAGEDVRILFNKQFSDFPAALSDLRKAINTLQEANGTLCDRYDQSLQDIPLQEMDLQWRQACAKFWPLSWFARRKVGRLLQTYASQGSGPANPTTDLQAIEQKRDAVASIAQNLLKGQTSHWNDESTDLSRVQRQLELAKKLRQAIKQVGRSHDRTNEISKAIHPSIGGRQDSPAMGPASLYDQKLSAFYSTLKQFAKLSGKMPIGKQTTDVIASAKQATDSVLQNRTFLKRWTMWNGAKQKAHSLGLKPLVAQLETRSYPPEEAITRFRFGYADWFVPRLVDSSPVLRKFDTTAHEHAINEFKELDAQARKLAAGQARRAMAHDLPSPDSVAKASELGILSHQMNLKRPRKSIREVVTDMPDSFRKLAPCLLMSPLSIAQYLPAVQEPFDVVIFDEASQIPTWDAIGAIARGKQTIIVGDPKQLPPTNFFGKTDDEEDENLEDHERDLESILDETLASGLPEMTLNWHYRSRHESLIAFSNYKYYRNELITFPSAESENRGLSLVQVTDAAYDKGKSRTNRKEAEAIVADAVQRMKNNLSCRKGDRLTFGVITFNIQQQTLIEDLFEAERRKSPEIEWFFSEDRIEPTVVKNLENVQGDERDVMYFSITFGPTETDPRVGRNFGALNRDGGERRLNVAVTRARQQMMVYASFTSDQLDVSKSKSVGLSHLKQFLEFAEHKGSRPLGGETQDSVGGFDSPFEQAVAEALELRGWQVVPQIGVSGFRIDLGIRHPDKPGAYLAGVECDGATYHRSAAARDRDKTRQLVLEGLGWNIERIWSPDWWYASEVVLKRVDEQLNEWLELDRSSNQADDKDDSPDGVLSDENANDAADESPDIVYDQVNYSADASSAAPKHEFDDDAESQESVLANLSTEEDKVDVEVNAGLADSVQQKPSAVYRVAKLDDCSPDSARFFESDYRETIRDMALEILSAQGPVREDLLAAQIARAHGFRRTGSKIRNHILAQIKDCPSTSETSGRFLWSWEQTIEPLIDFRVGEIVNEARSIAEISVAELCGLVRELFDEMEDETDAVVFIARRMGVGRVSQSARERLAEAIERYRDLE